MFERFTDRARRVVILAQDNARARHDAAIYPQHLLVSLYDEGEGIAAVVLKESGFDRNLPQYTSEGGQAGVVHLPFTDTTKKILERSLREALQLGHNYIGTEHLLLAIITLNDEIALIDWTSPLELRAAVIAKLRSYKPATTRTVSPREDLIYILKPYVSPKLLAEAADDLVRWFEHRTAPPQPE